MYQPIRNKNLPWQPCFLSNQDEMRKIYKGPSIDAPYQILINLAKRFQRRRFLMYQLIRNKNRPWQPCLLTDLDEMSNLYKVPSLDAPYKILIHLAKPFKRRRFLMNQPIRNKNRPWRPCFLSDRDEMRKIDKGPSIDAPYQIIINLATQFQRRRFLMNQPIRNKICLTALFFSHWDKMRKLPWMLFIKY